ncbi:transcription factor MYB1R1-like [Mercurialis annua]|uniref:transcription factor MYB1R1-like n=1 Tax=Mercurialis annua TaxID=3986 RepID=UPI00215ED7EA|nr:transcription factor MYB1R1-like [Mercurialis annua]
MAGTCTGDGGGGCGGGAGAGAGEIMLFGVRVVVDSMRKSVSLNNLSQYEHHIVGNEAVNRDAAVKDDVANVSGYASADDAVPHSSSTRGERKRGVPWTEEEHKLFLLGLQKVGKGDWRGISRNFVKTRTPTQVASHAQKYFLRRSNLNRRRRRSSLFDITTDTVTAFPMEEQVHRQDKNKNNSSSPVQSPALPETSNFTLMPVSAAFSISTTPVVLPLPIESPTENLSLLHGNPVANLIRPVPIMPSAPFGSGISDLNLNLQCIDSSTLSLKLSLQSDQKEAPSAAAGTSRHSAFQVMSSFNNGDGIITVA